METFTCPKCEKEARTARGLIKHMTGGRKYGGHELTPEMAVSLASGNSELAPALRPEWSQLFIAQLFASMVRNKALPKVQFERQIHPFIGQFLPDILGNKFGGRFRVVADEFPLKKITDLKTTNVDFLALGGSEDQSRWVFVELKTDTSSIRESQLAIYLRAMSRSMEELLADVEEVKTGSSQPQKYSEVLARFDRPAASYPIELVYISPRSRELQSLLEAAPRCHLIGFHKLGDVEVTNHRFEWHLFKELIVSTFDDGLLTGGSAESIT